MAMAVAARNDEPRVEIEVQPASLRFRYVTENRSSSPITGKQDKTFPTIRVVNYDGEFVVVISCVTKDEPYYPHPHNIVERTRRSARASEQHEEPPRFMCGVYQFRARAGSRRTVAFQSLAIQCVRKSDIVESLEKRRSRRIDPYRTGYGHMDNTAKIDLSAIRLCFQVFLKRNGVVHRVLDPVVSDVVYDQRVVTELRIFKLSHTTLPADGGREVITLCSKVTNANIQVWFYKDDDNGARLWEERANITSVHKTAAICFISPNCRRHLPSDGTGLHPAKVHLRRILDGETEEGEGRELFLKVDDRKRRRPVSDLDWPRQPADPRGRVPLPSIAVPRYVQDPPQEAVQPQPMYSYEPRPVSAFAHNSQLGTIDPTRVQPILEAQTLESHNASYGRLPITQPLVTQAAMDTVGGPSTSHQPATPNWQPTQELYVHGGQNVLHFNGDLQYHAQEDQHYLPTYSECNPNCQQNGNIAGNLQNQDTDQPLRYSFNNLTLQDPLGGISVLNNPCGALQSGIPNVPTSFTLANGHCINNGSEFACPMPSNGENSNRTPITLPTDFSPAMYETGSSGNLGANTNPYETALPDNTSCQPGPSGCQPLPAVHGYQNG